MSTTESPSVASRANLLNAYRALAGVLSVLVLVQAAMAGHSERLFGGLDIVAHGILGNVTYLLAVGGLTLTIVAKAHRAAIGVAAALVLLMTIQIGLGYSGRDSNGAAAWHIPNGVAIFGLAVYQVSQARDLLKGELAA